jgi:putative transposase
LADSFVKLQAQVDAFDDVYNTQRPHQGLPGRITPLTAWQATAKAEAPRPHFERPQPSRLPSRLPDLRFPEAVADSGPTTATSLTDTPVDLPTDLHVDTCIKTLSSAGTFMLDRVQYRVDGQYGFECVLVTTDDDKIIVTDLDGEVLIVLMALGEIPQ